MIKIKWHDACDKELNDELIKSLEFIQSGKELLAINTTYGKVLKKLKDVIVVATEESDSADTEATIIPRGWIISPKNLK